MRHERIISIGCDWLGKRAGVILKLIIVCLDTKKKPQACFLGDRRKKKKNSIGEENDRVITMHLQDLKYAVCSAQPVAESMTVGAPAPV